MAPKLSDSDKNTIVELYQQPDESTATLASRYGVSSSTISRILKQALSDDQYKDIVRQKKGGGSKPQFKESEGSKPEVAPDVQQAELNFPSEDDDANQDAGVEPAIETATSETSISANELTAYASVDDGPPVVDEPSVVDEHSTPEERGDRQPPSVDKTPPPPILKKNAPKLEPPSLQPDNLTDNLTNGWDDEISANLLDLEGLDGEDLEGADLDDLDNDLDDEDLDDEDDSSNEDDFSDDEGDFDFALNADVLSVLPFSEAKLPRTCYIIIDRAAELITRPLKAFSDLGEVPAEDVDAQTLPIFDNHRVAKRFVNRRTQRIVKIPDAQVLRKTSSYLLDKGITRLLLGGQVYALMDDGLDDYDYENDFD